MAPISKFILTGALAAFVAARPLNVPRAPVEVTETAWTTIDVAVTLWVDENGTPLSTVAPGGNFATVPTDIPAAVVTSTTTSAPVVAGTPTPTPTPSPTTTTPPVIQKQIETTTPPAQAAYSPPPAAASSPAPGSSPAPASSPAPVSSPNSSRDGGAVSASASNSCEGTGAACSGDITHWDGGLGACGWNVNTGSDMQIALPVGLMGSQSNGNPYCGRSLTIKNPTTGQTVQATVGDKCMGCEGRSIDLTNALFAAVGGGCDGRCSGFEWWFN